MTSPRTRDVSGCQNGADNSQLSACRAEPYNPTTTMYYGWRDEPVRLLQCSKATPCGLDVTCSTSRDVTARDVAASRTKPNTYYQDLVQSEYERNLENMVNSRRPCMFRCGSKGAPWRQLKLTTGARGENVMFVDGDVKVRDMSKFYPADDEDTISGGVTDRRGPPRPLPHFYVGNVALDPNKSAALMNDRKAAGSKSKKTPRQSSKDGATLAATN